MGDNIKQLALFKLSPIESDIVYTPEHIAKEIIEWVNPTGFCLDPCMGDGAFFNNLPKPKDWCEIEKGKDFIDYNKKVDWIIGNPPYSIFKDFLRHSFEIADNVVYILPTNKVFQRLVIMDMIEKYGGIKGIKLYGAGSNVGFPFGFSTGTFHFSKDYKGLCDIELPSRAI